MKKFGFMLMAAAVMAMSFTSCEKKSGGDDPIVPPSGGDDVKVPAVDATPGAVTLLIYFDQDPCDGYDIRFVGDHKENGWNIASAPAMQKVEGQWYKYLVRPGSDEEGATKENMSGRPIQAKAGDEDNWGYDWSHNPEEIEDIKGVQEGMKATNEYGETNLNFTAQDATDGAIVAFRCKKWNTTPCAVKEKYNITVIVPAFCDEEFPIELVGSFEGWGTTPVALTKVEGTKYQASIDALEGQEWKVRGVGGWDKEIQKFVPYDEKEDKEEHWAGVDNNVLGAEKNITVDYSDAEKYRWNVCAPSEEE